MRVHPQRTHRHRALTAVLALCLAACSGAGAPASGSSAQRLSLVSWNVEWLAELHSAGYWEQCRRHAAEAPPDLPPCDAYRRYAIADAQAYAARKLAPLREGFAAVAARGVDVIALQEVQSAAALRAVLPAGYRIACLTARADALNLAFVVREGLVLRVACREIPALSLEGDAAVARPVRRGLELSLHRGDQDVVMLNVHLKAGCPRGRLDAAGNAACGVMQRQAAPLERWVEEQAAAGRPFLILGDWNRDLDVERRGGFPARSDGGDAAMPGAAAMVRNLLAEIDDGDPPQGALSLARTDRSAAADGVCHEALDQLVVSARLLAALDAASLVDGSVAARLVRMPRGASDHCALESELSLK